MGAAAAQAAAAGTTTADLTAHAPGAAPAASAWPNGDTGRVILHVVVDTSVDALFEDLFGSYSDLQVGMTCAPCCGVGAWHTTKAGHADDVPMFPLCPLCRPSFTACVTTATALRVHGSLTAATYRRSSTCGRRPQQVLTPAPQALDAAARFALKQRPALQARLLRVRRCRRYCTMLQALDSWWRARSRRRPCMGTASPSSAAQRFQRGGRHVRSCI